MTGGIVILSGPPASGKSTLATALAATAARPAVRLPLDQMFDFILCGRLEPWLAAAHAQNAAVVEATARASAAFASAGYLTVVEGVLGPWFLKPFGRLGVPIDYVVLRPALAVLLGRARARGAAGLAASGPIRGLHDQFVELGALERHALDCGAMTPDQTLERVREGLVSGAFRLDPI